MTYAAQKGRTGREPVTIVEMDLDYCTLVYGTGPCTAVLGTTGAIQCFNTQKTCQATGAYTPATKTYRFSDRTMPASSNPLFNTCIPSLQSVQLAPTALMPGSASPASTTSGGQSGSGGLGRRASITLTFRDHPHPDNGIDKYVASRPYNSATQGTFWGKLIARNPYYQNRQIRVKSGYITPTMDPLNFETRTYVLDQISGPDARGIVTIIAKDPLKLLDNDKVQAPTLSLGTLAAAMDAVTTTATMTTGTGAAYPASGVVTIGSECMSYTRVGDVLTVTRGASGTVAAAHSVKDPVQLAVVYTAQGIYAILYDLVVTRGGVPNIWVDSAGWQAEINAWLADYVLTVVLPKPVGINQLISEMCEQCLFTLWWDERTQLIKFKALRPSQRDTVRSITDATGTVADSQMRTERVAERLTQVWVCYGLRDPTIDLKKLTNYAALQVSLDAAAQSAVQYGDARTRIIYSRWFQAGDAARAKKLGDRLLTRFRDVPKTFVIRLDAKDSSLWTGDVVQATIRTLVDPTGAPVPTNLQITQVKEVVAGSEYEYTLEDTFYSGRYAFVTPNSMTTYTPATAAQKLRYGFLAPNSGIFADQTPAYKVI